MLNKSIIYSLLILILPLVLYAGCINKHLMVFPYQPELPTKPMFLLLVDNEMEEFIQDSIEKYPIIIVSENDTVKLELIGRYPNEFNLIQYLATTEKNLKSNNKYHIEIYSNHRKQEYYNFKFGVHINPWGHEWLVKDSIKIEKPKFLSPPKKLYGTYFTPGCGPEVFDTYEIISNDNNYNLVEINVKRGSHELITYFPIDETTIKVGKGMCFGGYVFKESEPYDVSFTLINCNGERSESMHIKNMNSPSWEVESEEFRMYMR